MSQITAGVLVLPVQGKGTSCETSLVGSRSVRRTFVTFVQGVVTSGVKNATMVVTSAPRIKQGAVACCKYFLHSFSFLCG